MNKILNEQLLVEFWWTMGHKKRKLNKASEAFKKEHQRYTAAEKDAVDAGKTDSSLLATKREGVVSAARNYKERQQAVNDKQLKNDTKLADKLVNNTKFARKYDFKSLTPSVSALYEKKMKDKKDGKTVTSKGDVIDPKDLDALADQFKESYISSIYFRKPILKEGFVLDSLKETYTAKEFFNVLQESIVNFDLLKEEQIVDLIDKLGFEYLEEGKRWNKAKTGARIAALITGGILGGRALAPAKDATDAHKNYRDNNHVVEIQQDTINKANAERLAKFDLDILTDEEKQENKETIDKATAERDVAASAAGTSKAKRNAAALTAGVLGAGAMGAIAGGVVADKKQKDSVNRYVNSKNKEVEGLKKRVEEAEKKETNPKQTKK